MNRVPGDICPAASRPPSPAEAKFMNSFAYPLLDRTRDEKSLTDLFEVFWNLCLWEKCRADILDTKASYLLGLSGIAAAVVAVGGVGQSTVLTNQVWAGGISLAFFAMTVVASLYALFGKKYGTFYDKDVFLSLTAHEEPVGNVPPFQDKDPRRCFLRETIVQRWLIYRWYCNANNAKFNRLVVAQILAVLSVLSLFGYLIMVFFGG